MNKYAFPVGYRVKDQFGEYPEVEYGLSQRLYIATQIANGIVSVGTDRDVSYIASESFRLADELIKQDENRN